MGDSHILDQDQRPDIPRGLQLYWFEIEPSERVGAQWAQVVGVMDRLVDLREELLELSRVRDVEKRLRRMETIVEGYFLRVYELRERVLHLLLLRTGLQREVEQLKHENKRQDALSRLKKVDPAFTASIEILLPLLAEGVRIRNLNTHRFYVGFVLSTQHDVYDPYDAMLDLSRAPVRLRRLKTIVGREIKITAATYAAQMTALITAITHALETGEFVKQ